MIKQCKKFLFRERGHKSYPIINNKLSTNYATKQQVKENVDMLSYKTVWGYHSRSCIASMSYFHFITMPKITKKALEIIPCTIECWSFQTKVEKVNTGTAMKRSSRDTIIAYRVDKLRFKIILKIS